MALTHIQTGTRGYVQIGNNWAAGSEIFVVDGDNERVGVGTESPTSTLHVNGDIRGDAKIIFTGTGFINNNSTNLELETVSNKDIIFKPHGTGDVSIGAGGQANLLVVSASGDVHIAQDLVVDGMLTA